MTRPLIFILNENGEEFKREMTEEEYAQYLLTISVEPTE